jgi:hypothetical protein
VRKSEARLLGYNTPDDTIQSFLWAIQNRDLTNLLHAYATEPSPQALHGILQTSASNDVFRNLSAVVGMAILSRKELSNGRIELEVELGPNMPPAPFRLRQVDGLWKIDGHL